MKRSPLKPRSRKRAALMVQRRKLVAAVLAAHPTCEVPWCNHESTDVHEPLTRARGGSIVDPSNVRAVCRMHHDLIHLEPAWAYDYGFLVHSWDAS